MSPGPDRDARTAATREILRLAWPVMASQILLNLTGLIDRMMIGRLAEAGGAAVPLAAVGYASQLFHLVHTTLFAVGLACVALMARAIGAGDATRARQAFTGSVQISTLVTGVYAGLLLSFTEPALALLGAEPAVVAVAAPYLRLTVGASIVLAFTLIFESALRADRRMRTPMLIGVAVTACKLGLNAVLIFGWLGAPRLEVVGAGLATAASQTLGLGLYAVLFARAPRDAATAFRPGDLLRRNPMAREVIRIALPGVAERVVLNLGLLSYFAILSHYYGTLSVAVYTVGVSILAFSWIPGTGYAQACATVVGQSLGAGRADLATDAGRRSLWLAIATGVPMALVCALLREPLARAFTDDGAVIAGLSPFMLALALGQPFLQMHFTLAGVHRGAGDTVTPLFAAMVSAWGIRLPLAIAVGAWLGLDVVWIWVTLVLDHIARAAWLGASFARGRWRETRAGS